MEFKGTKGIWEITDGNPNVEGINALRIQNDSEVQWDICAVWNDIETEEEAKANALLISNAPELFKFIKDHYMFLNLKDQEKAIMLMKKSTEL